MVEVTSFFNGQARKILLGLAESEQEKALENITFLTKRTWLTRASDHIIEFLQNYFGDKVEVVNHYPINVNESNWTQFNLPRITVSIQAGVGKDIGMGMLLYADGKKSYIGYNQTAFINVDVWAKTMRDALTIAGHVSEQMMIHGRRGYLLSKGFQYVRVEYSSRSQVGFEYWRNYLYNPNFLTIPIFRHIMVLSTSFDVVLEEPQDGAGIITQIVLSGKDTYSWQDILGTSMEYLYAEAKYLKWFNLGV